MQSKWHENSKRNSPGKFWEKYRRKKGHFCLQTTILRRVPKFELPATPAREFSKTWNLVSVQEICRATGMNISKEIRLENFEKSIVEKGSLLPTNEHIETGTQVRAPDTPTREFSKRWNLVSIEGVYRETSRNLLKQVRRENFQKSLVDYKGLMLFSGCRVPKFELLGTPAREI